jgi:hypothetical protein
MFIPPPPSSFNGNLSTSNSDLDLSSTGMIAVQIYGYGGLAFMFGIVISALGLWFWTVVIKREWADSPPDIMLHPEVSHLPFFLLIFISDYVQRMREKERARQERLKCRKEEKLRRSQSDREKKFSPPPIRLNQKGRKSSFTSTTSTLHPPNRSSLSINNPKPIPRKSSFSVSPPKGLRVSWASSAATLDEDGHMSVKSMKAESTTGSLPSIKFPFDTPTPTSIPRARTSVPRLSASIAARAPRGDEMIAITTPDTCESWSKPANPLLVCRCGDSVDPLDTRTFARCDVHHYRD